jgi:hypothetical protein
VGTDLGSASIDAGTEEHDDCDQERGEPTTRVTVTRCHWRCARPSQSCAEAITLMHRLAASRTEHFSRFYVAVFLQGVDPNRQNLELDR